MPAKSIYFRKLRKYKYQLIDDYKVKIEIRENANNKFIELNTEGLLTIRKNYAWDGPSGPTRDTSNFMRASLVHDALYQLMRAGDLDIMIYRDIADLILYAICIEDGMGKIRAKIAYLGLRWFGAAAARPTSDIEDETRTAP